MDKRLILADKQRMTVVFGKQEAHGQHCSPEYTVQINKLWLREGKKTHNLLFEKWMVLHLNKLKSPSLCQVWLKLAQYSEEEDYLNFINIFSLLCNSLPLEKGGPSIWTNLSSHHQGMPCVKFGWNWPSGSGEEDENVKSLGKDGRTDRRRTTGDQKSSLELSAQVS